MSSDLTKIIFTCDVEGKKGVCELDKQLDLIIDNTKCGLNKILEVADVNNIKITFFIDVYEIKKSFGLDPVKHLTQHIFERGHDIQLHTHPGPFFDYKRNKMYQFSDLEQEGIIKTGSELIYKWTGYYPEAHRAGAYAADSRTISVLKRAGFKLDSSYFTGHRNCKLRDDFQYYNDLYQIEGILELPVTIFTLYEQPGFLKNYFTPIISTKKIDLDASSLFEMKEAISNARRLQYNTVTIFMHSFSLIKNDGTPDPDDIQKLEKLMKWIANNNFKIATARDLLTNTQEKIFPPYPSKDDLEVTRRINFFKYLLKRLTQRKKRIWA